MKQNEFKWRVRRVVDVNHQSGLIEELMDFKQGQRKSMSTHAFMVLDKFLYLRGNLDDQSDDLRASMGKKIHTGHPFIPRPPVWHNELMRIVRKARRGSSSFEPSRLATWEQEVLVVGEAFDKNYIDAGRGTWERMFRIQMTLKRGIPLNPVDREFHDRIISAIPDKIKKEYKLK